MYKIFTDSDKWDKKWFRTLYLKYKCFWYYIIEKSSRAGIWEVDLELAGVYIGSEFDKEKLLDVFAGRISEIQDGEKWIINKYIGFQYGNLSENNNMHAGVIKELERYGIKIKDGRAAALEGQGSKKKKSKGKGNGKNYKPAKTDIKKAIKSNVYEIINYLNKKINKNYPKKTTTATGKKIIARLNEGYKVKDFKAVIDNKVDEWQNNKKMAKYLRPSTLFAYGHFEEYRNQGKTNKTVEQRVKDRMERMEHTNRRG